MKERKTKFFRAYIFFFICVFSAFKPLQLFINQLDDSHKKSEPTKRKSKKKLKCNNRANPTIKYHIPYLYHFV